MVSQYSPNMPEVPEGNHIAEAAMYVLQLRVPCFGFQLHCSRVAGYGMEFWPPMFHG